MSMKCPNIDLSKKSFRARRTFMSFTSIPAPLLPPVIFTGLLLGLWTWKCFWIIVMQNKLLYLTWLPPFTRSDTISEYESQCKPVVWTERQIRSFDGTKLAICEGQIPVANELEKPRKKVVILYFQGNGGSTPLRLPLLSQFLNSLTEKSPSGMSTKPSHETSYVVLALSYRGYWKSSGRATQSGIEQDAQAFLNWVSKTYSAPDMDCQVFLWGHSLGAAVASSALGTHLVKLEAERWEGKCGLIPISGLILEAPISSIKDMLIGLYPQKWLPYRYLWPFSWNTWCTATSLERLASWSQSTGTGNTMVPNKSFTSTRQSVPPILILSAEKDEVIPPQVGGQLESVGRERGLDIHHTNVPGAMHTECSVRNAGKEALMRFILHTGKSRHSNHMQAKNVRM
ncbi:hypothetical protein N7528_009101 [Penicillium herquei]|nr:hypothetical protein N7528_009101 [Penicillium herquei]